MGLLTEHEDTPLEEQICPAGQEVQAVEPSVEYWNQSSYKKIIRIQVLNRPTPLNEEYYIRSIKSSFQIATLQ